MMRDNNGRPLEGHPEFRDVMQTAYPYHDVQVEAFIKEVWCKIKRFNLNRFHIPAKVLNILPVKGNTNKHVMLSNGDTVDAKNVVLSVGFEKTNWPSWAKQLKEKNPHAPIFHPYDQGYDLNDITKKYDQFVVVGGGWTALRLTELLAKRKPGNVTLISRTDVVGSGVTGAVIHPCWLKKGECYEEFSNAEDPAAKALLLRSGQPAGVTDDSAQEAFQQYLEKKQIAFIKGDIKKATYKKGNIDIQYRLIGKSKNPNQQMKSTCILLATGFSDTPGGQLLNLIKQNFKLPTTEVTDNYTASLPKLEEDLEWGKNSGIYLTGVLARALDGVMAGRLPGTLMTTSRLMESLPIQEARRKNLNASA
jgi:lysine/ornithine N-monooxygenase